MHETFSLHYCVAPGSPCGVAFVELFKLPRQLCVIIVALQRASARWMLNPRSHPDLMVILMVK